MDAERLMRIEGGAGGTRIFGDQLQIAQRGDQRDDKGYHERHPNRAADLLRDLASQGVDAGAEDVADDEEEEEPRAHDPMEAGLGFNGSRRGEAVGSVAHWASLIAGRWHSDRAYACFS